MTTPELPLPCPTCGLPLESAPHQGVPVWACRRCRGFWFDAGTLSVLADVAHDLPPRSGVIRLRGSRRACPRCRLQLDERTFLAGGEVSVDACPSCGGVWLDRGEFRRVERLHRTVSMKRDLRDVAGIAPDGAPVDGEARSLLAHYKRAVQGDVTALDYLLLFFLGIPVEHNMAPRRAPVINWSLIGINIAAFAATLGLVLSGREDLVTALALDSAHPTLATALTSAFLHAGVIHLTSNMVMLWLTGDNVEDYLGKPGYLAYYLGGALASAGAYSLANAGGSSLAVGASGAISAVMAAYVMGCPMARITLMAFFVTFTIPFGVMIAFWLVLQIVAFQVEGDAGIAYSAHLGGFVYGLIVFGAYRLYLHRRTGL